MEVLKNPDKTVLKIPVGFYNVEFQEMAEKRYDMGGMSEIKNVLV